MEYKCKSSSVCWGGINQLFNDLALNLSKFINSKKRTQKNIYILLKNFFRNCIIINNK